MPRRVEAPLWAVELLSDSGRAEALRRIPSKVSAASDRTHEEQVSSYLKKKKTTSNIMAVSYLI